MSPTTLMPPPMPLDWFDDWIAPNYAPLAPRLGGCAYSRQETDPGALFARDLFSIKVNRLRREPRLRSAMFGCPSGDTNSVSLAGVLCYSENHSGLTRPKAFRRAGTSRRSRRCLRLSKKSVASGAFPSPSSSSASILQRDLPASEQFTTLRIPAFPASYVMGNMPLPPLRRVASGIQAIIHGIFQ